jgi:glycerophosphoryl diester phosphodiesterase
MTLIVAHRGASAEVPENTLAAFQRGVELGADAVELDVHLTADGQLAVIHDDTLDRTTDRVGRIADLTMDAIREADAGATFAPDGDAGFPFAGQGLKVPTLPDVLAWLPDDIGLVVEIKARGAADAVVETLHDNPVRQSGRLTVISFDEPTIERVHALDPELRTGYLLVPYQPIEPALVWATERGHASVNPWEGDLGIDPMPILAQARAFGRDIGCYVVNDPQRMQHLAAYGLWSFVTDVPAVARAALGPRSEPAA